MAASTQTDAPDNFLAPPNDLFRKAGILKPLDRSKREIRLLRLHPAQFDTPIKLELATHLSLLSPDVEYYALSYAVGSISETTQVSVNDLIFNVTVRLDYALRQLRKNFCLNESCLVWLDQISINQTDSAEKSQQVLLMRQIYRTAKNVIVSLGDSPYALDGAMAVTEIIDYWQSQRRELELRDPASSHNSMKLTEQDVVRWYVERLLDPTDPTWRRKRKGLVEFCQALYWRRCWVYQEFFASTEIPVILWGLTQFQEIHIGSIATVLKHGFSWLAESYYDPVISEVLGEQKEDFWQDVDILQARDMIRCCVYRNFWRTNLFTLRGLLNVSRDLQSLDPRDRVYAILGLSATQHGIIPNYYPNNPVSNVYREAALACALHERTLDFLCEMGEKNRTSAFDLPSWVPDYSVAAGPASRLYMLTHKLEHHCTKHQLPMVSEPQSDKSPLVLTIQLILFSHPFKSGDLGDKATPTFSGEELSNSWLAIAQKRYRELQTTNYPVLHNEDVYPTSLEQTFNFGCDLRGTIDDPDYEPEETLTPQQDNLIDSNAEDMANDGKHLAYAASEAGEWRFFCLQNGIIGMTLSQTEPGDRLSFIPGCKLPIVLRPAPPLSPTRHTYSVVGPAYVHGYMDGLAIEEFELSKLEKQWVDLV